MNSAGRQGDRARLERTLGAVVLTAILLFAYVLTFLAGERGFFPFDQSIVFDGSYRIVSGQVPYRDFLMPFGPVTFWIQALIFKLLGVNYFAYVFGAAVVNVVAAALAILIVRLALPGSKVLSYLAGFVTAVWFYPPSGTPWADQTAFFFSLLAIAAVLAAVQGRRRAPARLGLCALCGGLSVVTFMSKQNVGLMMLPLYPLLLSLRFLADPKESVRGLASFGAGLIAAAAGFSAWLGLHSDPSLFVRYVWSIPAKEGATRVNAFLNHPLSLLKYHKLVVSIALGSFVLVGVAAGVAVLARGILKERRSEQGLLEGVVPAVLVIYLLGFQYAFMSTTANQISNCIGMIGIVLVVGAALTFSELGRLAFRRAGGPGEVGGSDRGDSAGWVRRVRTLARALAVAWLAVTVIILAAIGIHVSMGRNVQDIFRGSRFAHRLATRGLDSIKWGEPTKIKGVDVTRENVEELARYLETRGGNFFTFPDFTVLYGALGRTSPQPVLWFHKGLTYSRVYDERLDRWIVEDLEKNGVETVVIEDVSFMNTERRLNDFPLVKAFITDRFREVRRIGIFIICERRSA